MTAYDHSKPEKVQTSNDVTLSSSPLPRQQRSMVVLALDMSVVRNLHVQLETQAVTDSLTGLLNREGFLAAVAGRTLDHGDIPSAVLVFDLERFAALDR